MKEDCCYVYPYFSLINHVLVILSFTTLHRLTQLCFTTVILDSRQSFLYENHCEYYKKLASRLLSGPCFLHLLILIHTFSSAAGK